MGIQGRSLEQQEYERQLERAVPMKIKLIRARAFNCVGGSCFQNGRDSLVSTCPVCNGTGYLGGTLNGDDTQPPFSDTHFIYGDVQIGHGLLGSGGDYVKLLADLGRQKVGDGTLFTKMFDHDRLTGQVIYPIVDETLPRPDRVISLHGSIYNVVRGQIIEIGAVPLGRMFTVEQGVFSALAQGNMR